MRLSSIVVLAGFSACLTSPAQAGNVDINSFLTLGAATISEDGTYLANTVENIAFENDSHYGVNLRTQVSDRVSGAAQLLATATRSNFNLDAEWAYLSYQISNDVSVRAGKLNLTTFLLSDYAMVGYLHPWVRPPVEVYNNNPLRNFLGLELLNVERFGRTAKLTSQFFIGSAQADNGALHMRANDGYGVNLQLDTPGFTLRVGAISPVIQVTGLDATGNSVELLDQNDRGVMYTVGASIDVNNFVMYTETVATNTDGQTQGIFPNQKGAYLTLGYNIGKFLPHVTFGSASGEVYTGPTDQLDPLCGGALGCGASVVQAPKTQDSVALGLKYTIDESVSIKFEIQKVDLTPGKGQGFAKLQDPSVESFNVLSVAMDAIF